MFSEDNTTSFIQCAVVDRCMPEVQLTEKQLKAVIHAVGEELDRADNEGREEDLDPLQKTLRKLYDAQGD